MILKQFQKWIPMDNLASTYDVENITWGEGICFTLVADKKRIASDDVYCFQLTWDNSHIISYNITDETYRADCWELDFESNGRFYTSKNTEYIESFKQKSPLFPDNVIHFLVVGTNMIVDVLAKDYPSVKCMDC